MNAITVENVSFKYADSDKNAVNNVSLEIKEGSYTAIVGANGSGKSTLARLICNLEVNQSGNIQVDSNKRIGMLFQSPKEQIVSSIVYRDTSFGPKNLGLQSSEIELRTIECLNIVGLLQEAENLHHHYL